MSFTTDMAFAAVRCELERASAKFQPFNSAHEGYAIIEEEFDEMWDEIKANNLPLARQECIQLAAMALRFLIDVKPSSSKPAPPK